MEFLETLGIDYRLLIAQIINFAILLFILRRFAYKPIIQALERRKATIAKSLDDAKALEVRVNAGEQERQEKLRRADDEAGQILADARKQAEVIQHKMLQAAEAEVQAIKLHAATEAKEMKARALDEARGELADVVTAATEKLLREKVTSSKDRTLIERSIDTLTR